MSPQTTDTRVRGVCHVFLALDVSQSIDLNQAAAILRESATRPNLTHRFRAPEFIAYQPPPLRVTQACDGISVGAWQATGTMDITLFDFGAASSVYRIPFDGTLSQLARLSDALQNNPEIREDARARVASLCALIEPAMQRPAIKPEAEDYAAFQIEEVLPSHPPDTHDASNGSGPDAAGSADDSGDTGDTGASLSAAGPPFNLERFLASNARLLANVLRGDPGPLSDQEIKDAMSGRLSFTTRDAAVVDWSAALIVDQRPADVLAVLEFANIELLEMRYLDNRLDEALVQSHETLMKRRWWSGLLGNTSRDLKRLATMQTDNALLFEGVNNAIKLVGDQYLARLYRAAAHRMGVPEWQAGVRRKLAALESLYSKVSDHASSLRMEFIEWIVVVLIAFEVVMGFVK